MTVFLQLNSLKETQCIVVSTVSQYITIYRIAPVIVISPDSCQHTPLKVSVLFMMISCALLTGSM